MNEKIIQMARDAGAFVNPSGGIFDAEQLERFATAIRVATKEEDAKICESIYCYGDLCEGWLASAAEFIRENK